MMLVGPEYILCSKWKCFFLAGEVGQARSYRCVVVSVAAQVTLHSYLAQRWMPISEAFNSCNKFHFPHISAIARQSVMNSFAFLISLFLFISEHYRFQATDILRSFCLTRIYIYIYIYSNVFTNVSETTRNKVNQFTGQSQKHLCKNMQHNLDCVVNLVGGAGDMLP